MAWFTPSLSLLADQFSWNGFVRYWKSWIGTGDSVVPIVVTVLIVSLLIIVRGKWR